MENSKTGSLCKRFCSVVKAVWPYIAITIAGELIIRIFLRSATINYNELNKYLFIISDGIENKIIFGKILKAVLPALIPLAIFIGTRNLVDIIINPGIYNACFVYFAAADNINNGDNKKTEKVLPRHKNHFKKYLKFRLLLIGIWIAYLVFCAIVLSSLLLIGLFMGELAVPYVIFLAVIFTFASIAMPLRISLAYPASRIDGFLLDDALRQSVKTTSPPYNYIRLLLIYLPLTFLQLYLIWLFPLGFQNATLWHLAVASIAAGVIRFTMICLITSAYMAMRKPREIDFNAIW